jgi:hypothetical protein
LRNDFVLPWLGRKISCDGYSVGWLAVVGAKKANVVNRPGHQLQQAARKIRAALSLVIRQLRYQRGTRTVLTHMNIPRMYCSWMGGEFKRVFKILKKKLPRGAFRGAASFAIPFRGDVYCFAASFGTNPTRQRGS